MKRSNDILNRIAVPMFVGTFDIEKDGDEIAEEIDYNIYMLGATDVLNGLVAYAMEQNMAVTLPEICAEILEHPADFAEKCLSKAEVEE